MEVNHETGTLRRVPVRNAGFRFGVGSGYHLFPGKEDDLGWATASYDSIQCIPIRVGFALYFSGAVGGSYY